MNLPDTTKAEPIFREFNVAFAGVFGSYARGEEKAESDIDLLVRFSIVPGLFTFARLQNKLSETFGTRVDLVTENALHPLMKDEVLNDLKIIYGKR